ncbi:MAG: response regulator [Betaproteobacteria bacterium]|nr:response regulator [Betaproteobacteria bacterium]
MSEPNQRTATVMIVDDEIGVRDSLSDILSDDGFAVVTAENAEAAHEQIGIAPVDMVLLDIWMPPGIDGVALLKRWKESKLLNFPVVMISAHATLDAAVEAMRCGAADILEKPFSSKRLLEVVHKQIAKSQQQLYDPALYAANLGKSPAITKIKGALMRAAAEATLPVAFIGSGECAPEFFARMLQRQHMPWVEVDNLAKVGENLEKLFGQAAGGHIYLRYPDEPDQNTERTLNLLLANSAKHKTRLICEFPHRLDEMHAAGKLGAELHRKFSELQIEVPRLQDYLEDLEAIINLATRRLTGKQETDGHFSADAIEELIKEAAQWQTDGLSRLLGIMRSALTKEDEDAPVDADAIRNLATAATAGLISLGEDVYLLPWRKARETFEKQYYVALMRRAKNNYQLAAKMSGLERTYLYRKIRTALGEDGVSAGKDEDNKDAS